MVRQTKKPTKSPSEDDWKRAIATFAHHRNFDDNEFREGVERLVGKLKSESEDAYETASQRERQEPHTLERHDGSAIILRIEKKGLTSEQIALAELDLLRIDLKELPTKSVVTVSPNELLKGPIENLSERTHWSVDEEKVVRSVRTQAERLREGAKRVQRHLDDYDQRRRAIKPVKSVAWHFLFETTEPWGVEPIEISKRIAAAVNHQKMHAGLSPEEHVALWHDNVTTRLSTWRKRKNERKPGRRK